VNVPRSRKIEVVDREKKAVVKNWSIGLEISNFPMALDEKSKRLFVVCRTPARLIVFDTDNGKTVAKIPTVGDSDDLFFDADRHRIYATGGEGAIVVYEQQGPDQYNQIGRITTAAGARTSLFVPEAGRLFVAVPHHGAQGLYDPDHFGPADHWGGFAVGFIILYTAWYIVRDTGSELMDVMPEQERIEQIRRVAMEVGGVLGVEKVRARNIGLTWHVELHLELSPVMTVKDAHEIASQARFAVREHLDWVADVIVHIEPFSGSRDESARNGGRPKIEQPSLRARPSSVLGGRRDRDDSDQSNRSSFAKSE
jgi:hypothetical protein